MAPGIKHDINDPLFRDRALSKPLYKYGDTNWSIKTDIGAIGGTGKTQHALKLDLDDKFELADDYDNR